MRTVPPAVGKVGAESPAGPWFPEHPVHFLSDSLQQGGLKAVRTWRQMMRGWVDGLSRDPPGVASNLM